MTPVKDIQEQEVQDRRAQFAADLAAVLGQIADTAIEREANGANAFEEVHRLAATGFGAVTLPVEQGGLGYDTHELFQLLTQLAEADSSIAHIFRVHFSLVEAALLEPNTRKIDHEVREISKNLGFLGGATSEPQNLKYSARVSTQPDGTYLLTGKKFYTTGTLYSHKMMVLALDDDDQFVNVFIENDRPGVTLLDDWDGFGQKASGSGSILFDQVHVTSNDFVAIGSVPVAQALYLFYQLVLLAVLVGISKAAVKEITEFVAGRNHNYANGNTELPQHDPQVLELIGELDSEVITAESVLFRAVEGYHQVKNLIREGAEGRESIVEHPIFTDAVRTLFAAQHSIIAIANKVTTQIFEVGGSSAVSTKRNLDRHWRNARTISSHNPIRFRLRQAGDLLVNGTPVQFTSGPEYRLATYGAAQKIS